jgi:hypothetical protein
MKPVSFRGGSARNNVDTHGTFNIHQHVLLQLRRASEGHIVWSAHRARNAGPNNVREGTEEASRICDLPLRRPTIVVTIYFRGSEIIQHDV